PARRGPGAGRRATSRARARHPAGPVRGPRRLTRGRTMDITAILARFLDEPRVARVRAVLDTYGHAAGGLLANGLAFSALFAAIPTMLLVLGLAGTVANDPAVRDSIGDALIAAFPPLEDLIDAALDAISRSEERRV